MLIATLKPYSTSVLDKWYASKACPCCTGEPQKCYADSLQIWNILVYGKIEFSRPKDYARSRSWVSIYLICIHQPFSICWMIAGARHLIGSQRCHDRICWFQIAFPGTLQYKIMVWDLLQLVKYCAAGRTAGSFSPCSPEIFHIVQDKGSKPALRDSLWWPSLSRWLEILLYI